MAFLLVEFGSQASEFLRITGLFVRFSGNALPLALLMVESGMKVSGAVGPLGGELRTFSHVASATVRYTRFEATGHVSIGETHSLVYSPYSFTVETAVICSSSSNCGEISKWAMKSWQTLMPLAENLELLHLVRPSRRNSFTSSVRPNYRDNSDALPLWHRVIPRSTSSKHLYPLLSQVHHDEGIQVRSPLFMISCGNWL